jgi:hypothetical protein
MKGPSSFYGLISVGEGGYRVRKSVGRWAESINNGVEASRAWQKGFLWTRENPFVRLWPSGHPAQEPGQKPQHEETYHDEEGGQHQLLQQGYQYAYEHQP